MVHAVWQGFLVGLILSLAAGPVMFALIQTSVKDGFWRALAMELGIILSDAFWVAFAMFSISQFVEDPAIQKYMFWGGGAIIILFGLRAFLSKSKDIKSAKDFMRGRKSHPAKLFAKGFIYNFFNPSIIFFWIGAVSLASAEYAGNKTDMIIHFSTTLFIVLLFDIAKAYFAHRLKQYIRPRTLILANRVLGTLFIGIGIALIIRGFWV